MVWTLLAMAGCNDETKEKVADVINLSKSSVAFAPTGGSIDIGVASPSQWEASCAETWIALQPAEHSLTVTVGENPSAVVRETLISLRSASDEKTITVRQAYTDDPVLIETSVEEPLEFDSEGETFTFRVETNGQWSATSSADWLTVSSDSQNGTVELSAAKNNDSHRAAEVTITSTRNDDTKNCTVAVEQISRDENPYYRLLGRYGLHAENWYYGGQLLGVSGTGTFCTVEEKEYRKSVYIKDLFTSGTVIEASYDKQTEQLTIVIGSVCKMQELSSGVVRYYYPMSINMNESTFYGGTLTGTYGLAYNDITETENCPAILLSGFHSGYTSFGLIGYQSQQYVHFTDLYYANGAMYLARMDDNADSSQSSVAQTAAGIPVPENAVVIMNR